jgi:hypothetical protein
MYSNEYTSENVPWSDISHQPKIQPLVIVFVYNEKRQPELVYPDDCRWEGLNDFLSKSAKYTNCLGVHASSLIAAICKILSC